MFKKIELWIVGLIILFFILLIILVSGVLRCLLGVKIVHQSFLEITL